MMRQNRSKNILNKIKINIKDHIKELELWIRLNHLNVYCRIRLKRYRLMIVFR